ncbi:MAG TPA: YceI family protein [Vicinamibacterales bacterium]
MSARHSIRFAFAGFLALSLLAAVITASPASEMRVPVKLFSGRVAIAGTSNIHDYTAATSDIRIVRLQLADGVSGPNFWDEIVKPGAIESFEVAIAAGSLSSPREGLDKNMYKALKVKEFPDITFRLTRFDGSADPGVLRAKGVLTIAGVEREVALDLKTTRHDLTFTVNGSLPLLMTDYGIAPPKAMLGVLKTDPKVTVTFETTLTIPLT